MREAGLSMSTGSKAMRCSHACAAGCSLTQCSPHPRTHKALSSGELLVVTRILVAN